MNPAEPVVQHGDYPALKRSADAASTAAQRLYLRLFSASLGSMFAGALLSTLTALWTDARSPLLAGSASLLLLSVILTLTNKALKREQVWFGGRAFCESMKTLTWRYMMRAEPFHREDADQRFHADVKAIHDARKILD